MITPTVTIIIPTVGRDSLFNAVLSAQNQLGAFVKEIIISLDFNYRESKLRLPPQSKKIPYRVVYPEEPGVANTLNTAILNAQTKLISWLSDDDTYTQIKILKQINYITLNKIKPIDYNNLFLISNFTIHELDTNIKTEHTTEWMIHKDKIEIGYTSLAWGLISGCSVLFSKELWLQAGMFPKDYRTTQDYVLWKRILDRSPIFKHTGQSGIITNVHKDMESKSLSHIHNLEKDTLLEFIFSGYLSSYQMHNLSLADQRALYYAPPTYGPTFESFTKNKNTHIKELCELELQLNKWCFILADETRRLVIDKKIIEELVHNVAKVLQENMRPFVHHTIESYPDSDLGYFLDSYFLDKSKQLIKICGNNSYNFKLHSLEKVKLIEECLKNYRHVILFNIYDSFAQESTQNLIVNLKSFDVKKEIVETNTIDSIKSKNLDNEFNFFIRNPFLANTNSLK
jgi:teichuronic acid biosynthesis glycosyltransferase TuaG